MKFTINGKIYETNINKDEFESFSRGLIFRLRKAIEQALRYAEFSPKKLDAVILIGGATRMPLIKATVSKMFGMLPFSNINPDEAVVLGAAVQVALKDRNEALKEMILTDVCTYTLGTNIVKKIR